MLTALRFYKKLQNVINHLIGIAITAIMFVILAQTFTRYVIFYSLPWSEELSRYLFVLMIMLGINIGISNNMMVRIDLIDNFIKGPAQTALSFIRDCICLFASSFFLYSTLAMIQIGRYQVSPAIRVPMHYMYIILFIGFLLSTLSVLFSMLERYTSIGEKPKGVGGR